ncbi:MAG: hypothetical protein H7Z72_04565 [Bacteroidetes bacterium]|nr:hypothetical protein [Fibrella sp.]
MAAPVPQKLTNAQVALLELFHFELSEAELVTMRQTLMQHFRQRLDDEAEKTIQQKGLTAAQFEQQMTFGNRTERLRQIRERR